jgi:ABC-type sugar transport system ATPase subunit
VENQPVLSLRKISKSFAGIKVLHEIDLDFYPGEVHCIVGENGAGKSTLIKIISGAYQPDEGSITYQGQVLRHNNPHLARQNGINAIYQEIDLIPTLNAAENISLGNEPTRKGGDIDWRAVQKTSDKILGDMGAGLDTTIPVQNLKVAHQQMVAIAKALSMNSKVLILDEPTAVFSGSEINLLFEIIEKLKSQGISIVYISHHLDEIFRIGDRVTVLRDGNLVRSGLVGEFDKNSLIKAMVGRDIDFSLRNKSKITGEIVLEVRDLTSSEVEGVSLTLRSGEIVGMAGLVGAGRTELARLILGADSHSSGEILLKGKKLKSLNPSKALGLGMGMLPESRKEEGLVLVRPMAENIAYSQIQRESRFGFPPWRKVKEEALKMVSAVDIRPNNPNIQVTYMSGGNQQKVVLSKLLAADCDVLILDEPTRGVDVGARMEIYSLMKEVKERGAAILMISSDLPEILTQSDRVLVMSGGKIAGEFSAAEATEEKVLKLALQIQEETL